MNALQVVDRYWKEVINASEYIKEIYSAFIFNGTIAYINVQYFYDKESSFQTIFNLGLPDDIQLFRITR